MSEQEDKAEHNVEQSAIDAILNASDDDIAEQDISYITPEETSVSDNEEDLGSKIDEDEVVNVEDEDEETDENEDESDDLENSDEDENEDDSGTTDSTLDDADESDDDSNKHKNDDDTNDDSDDDENTDTLEDVQANYNKIFAPFKANGRTMQAKSADDVISLMQMGANFSKKMNAIKEQVPYIKLLEQNNLLDQEKLSFLIDLQNGNPEAIAKLIQDNNIDTYEFNAEEKSKAYTPTNRRVSKEDVALDDAVESIKDSPSYGRTIEVLGKVWDEKSRQIIANEHPELIGTINQQMEDGLYDTIWDEVENQRAFGRLSNMNDLEAYYHVGNSIYSEGVKKEEAPEQVVEPNKAEKTKRKIAAGSRSRPQATKSSVTESDILNMSDEELELVKNKNYI